MNTPSIGGLAQGFLDSYSNLNPGWGQFIDRPHHPQRGGFGTASGALLCALSKTGSPGMIEAVGKRLLELSDAPSKQCQNIRLAWSYLGLASSQPRLSADIKDGIIRVRNRILAQKEADDLWGAYWVSDKTRDHQPSIFVSSFVLVCLVLATPDCIDSTLKSLGLKIQESYLDNPAACEGFEPLVFAAISLTLGRLADRRVAKGMKDFAWKVVSFSRLFIYFYDFEQPDGEWGRDYIVLPIDLLVPLTLRGESPSFVYQLRGLATFSRLEQNLKQNGGKFIGAEGKRPSSFEQALAGLAVVSVDTAGGALKDIAGWRRWIYKIYYHLLRDRAQSFELWGTGLVWIVYIVGTALFVFLPVEQTQRFVIVATFIAMNSLTRLIRLIRGMVGRAR